MHPCDTSSKYQITKFFKGLHETIKAVKNIRGGLELSHIGEGQRIVSTILLRFKKMLKEKRKGTADLRLCDGIKKSYKITLGKNL